MTSYTDVSNESIFNSENFQHLIEVKLFLIIVIEFVEIVCNFIKKKIFYRFDREENAIMKRLFSVYGEGEEVGLRSHTSYSPTYV